MGMQVRPSGMESLLGEENIIVSKTDLQGRITYANRTFLEISGYTEAELLGAPHNLIRHPEMPRCVFKYLWDTIRAGNEVFAYVVNLAKNGNHYWVLAHVTPSFDKNGEISGYHSNRRAPNREVLPKVQELYRELLSTEQRHSNPKDGMNASLQQLLDILGSSNLTYDQFVWSLIDNRRAA